MFLQKLRSILSTTFYFSDTAESLQQPIILSDLLDSWQSYMISEGNLALGSVNNYISVIRTLKTIPLSQLPLREITTEDLQELFDNLNIGYYRLDGEYVAGYSRSHILAFSAVLQGAFRYAVYPGKYISQNPMQQVVLRRKNAEKDLFQGEKQPEFDKKILTDEQFQSMVAYLSERKNPALLPIQIAYYTGLRLGEVCALTWEDINLQEQYMEIRRAVILNRIENRLEFTTTKRNKMRYVYFGKVLKQILMEARAEQDGNWKRMGMGYKWNYYEKIMMGHHSYYPLYSIAETEKIPEGFQKINLVCVRPDGAYESRQTVSNVCFRMKKQLPGMEQFHFHMLRHTYTSNLLRAGARPKDVQELLGHSDINTTMNIYAHAEQKELKRIVEALV